MKFAVQNMSTTESVETEDFDSIRGSLEQLMQNRERWQILAITQSADSTVVASGIWPDTSSLDDLCK